MFYKTDTNGLIWYLNGTKFILILKLENVTCRAKATRGYQAAAQPPPHTPLFFSQNARHFETTIKKIK